MSGLSKQLTVHTSVTPHLTQPSGNPALILLKYNKMNYPLRDKIARQMWALWVEENSPKLDGKNCPKGFYLMSEKAMRIMVKELDDMMLNMIRQKLDNLYDSSSNS